MSTKGLAVAVLPHLRSLLRPSFLPPAPLLPDTQVREIATLPWAFSNPLCRNREPRVPFFFIPGLSCARTFSPIFTRATMSLRHHLSTSAAPQGESSAKSPTEADKASLSLREILSSFAKAPMVPMFLGVAGAIPFLALTPPFPYWLPLPEVLTANPIEAQALYGTVILAFLGGPHWGLAMVGIHASPNHKIFNYASNSARYVWSVVPTLLAWPALLMTTVPKLQFLICSFGLVLAVDVIFASHGLTPPWYLPLRLLLSGIVILCLSASLLEVLFTQRLLAKKEKDVSK